MLSAYRMSVWNCHRMLATCDTTLSFSGKCLCFCECPLWDTLHPTDRYLICHNIYAIRRTAHSHILHARYGTFSSDTFAVIQKTIRFILLHFIFLSSCFIQYFAYWCARIIFEMLSYLSFTRNINTSWNVSYFFKFEEIG